MDIPTVHLSQAEFDALPITMSGGYDQPRCRYKASTGQWLLIEPGNCAVIEVGKEKQRRELQAALREMEREQRKDYADYLRRCGGVPVSKVRPDFTLNP